MKFFPLLLITVEKQWWLTSWVLVENSGFRSVDSGEELLGASNLFLFYLIYWESRFIKSYHFEENVFLVRYGQRLPAKKKKKKT